MRKPFPQQGKKGRPPSGNIPFPIIPPCLLYTSYGPRREGDPPRLIANPKKAKEILGWEARCKDAGESYEEAAVRELKEELGAVSYTHLDVYKRQVPNTPSRRRS